MSHNVIHTSFPVHEPGCYRPLRTDAMADAPGCICGRGSTDTDSPEAAQVHPLGFSCDHPSVITDCDSSWLCDV